MNRRDVIKNLFAGSVAAVLPKIADEVVTESKPLVQDDFASVIDQVNQAYNLGIPINEDEVRKLLGIARPTA